jgi:hypothetical protein
MTNQTLDPVKNRAAVKKYHNGTMTKLNMMLNEKLPAIDEAIQRLAAEIALLRQETRQNTPR